MKYVTCSSGHQPLLTVVVFKLIGFQQVCSPSSLPKQKHRWDHNDPECFFKPSVALNHHREKSISIFPDFSSKCHFPLTYKNVFSPTISWPVATLCWGHCAFQTTNYVLKFILNCLQFFFKLTDINSVNKTNWLENYATKIAKPLR